jgi:hypothetical protein
MEETQIIWTGFPRRRKGVFQGRGNTKAFPLTVEGLMFITNKMPGFTSLFFDGVSRFSDGAGGQ